MMVKLKIKQILTEEVNLPLSSSIILDIDNYIDTIIGVIKTIGLDYGEFIKMNDKTISLHGVPALCRPAMSCTNF